MVRGSGCKKGWDEEQASLGLGVGGYLQRDVFSWCRKVPCGGPPVMSSTGP